MKLSSVGKKKNVHHPPITSNNVSAKHVLFYKRLGLLLGAKLDFHEHISSILHKVNKMTAVLEKLQTVLPRHSLLTTNKAFI